MEKQGEQRVKSRGDLLFFRDYPPPSLREGPRVGVGTLINLARVSVKPSVIEFLSYLVILTRFRFQTKWIKIPCQSVEIVVII
jgi:hypothetical protein